MKCAVCRRRLLMEADPTAPPVEVVAHLAGCADCGAWRHRLLVIEGNVGRIPVPPSRGPRQVLDLLLRGKAAEATAETTSAPARLPHALPLPTASVPLARRVEPPASPVIYPWKHWSPRRRWLAAGGGAAAAAALIFLGVWLGDVLWPALGPRPVAQNGANKGPAPNPAPAVADSLLTRILECDLELARTTDRKERLVILARLAALLHAEARPLTSDGAAADLTQLAELYRRVLEDGIVARAEDVARAERGAVLGPVARQLERQHDEIRALANGALPAQASPLQQMAAVTRTGTSALRKMMEEGTP